MSSIFVRHIAKIVESYNYESLALGEQGYHLKSRIFANAAHEVHILYILAGGTLDKVVDSAYDYNPLCPGIDSQSYIAEVRTPDRRNIRKCTIPVNPDKFLPLIELSVNIDQFFC